MHLHNENNSQGTRPSGMTPPILSAAQHLLTEAENSSPQPSVSVEHLTVQSSFRQLQPINPPDEKAIHDNQNTMLHEDNAVALPDSTNYSLPPEIVVIDFNHPSIIQLVPPPQVTEYDDSSLSIAPLRVGNLPKRDLRRPEIKRSDKRQSMLTLHDEILQPQLKNIQASNLHQHGPKKKHIPLKTTQSDIPKRQKFEEKTSPQSSLLSALLQSPKSEHSQDRPRLTSNYRPLKPDDSHSFEMSDRTMMTTSSSILDSKFLLNDEAEASEETVNPEKYAMPIQPELSVMAKENTELREKADCLQRELNESKARRRIDSEDNLRLKEQIAQLEEQLTHFKRHEPLRALTKYNLSPPPASPNQCTPTCSQQSTNAPIPPMVFAKVRELSSLFGLPNDSDSDMHQLDKVLEGGVAATPDDYTTITLTDA